MPVMRRSAARAAFGVCVASVMMACSPVQADPNVEIWQSPDRVFHVTMPLGWQTHDINRGSDSIVLLAGPPNAPESNIDFQACQVLRSEEDQQIRERQSDLNADIVRYAEAREQQYATVQRAFDTVDGVLFFRADGVLKNPPGRLREVVRAFQVPIEGASVIYILMCRHALETQTGAKAVDDFMNSFQMSAESEQ